MPDGKPFVSMWDGVDEREPAEADVEQAIEDQLHASGPDVSLTADMVLEYHLLEDRLPGAPTVRELDFSCHLTHVRVNDQRIAVVSRDVLSHFPALTHVYLHHNRLTSTASLAVLHSLKFLTVSHNLLTKVEGLGELKELLFLDVSHNAIESLPAAAVPKSIRFLQINSNPCSAAGSAAESSTQEELLERLPNLRELDGVEVVPDDYVELEEDASTGARGFGDPAIRLAALGEGISGMVDVLEALERSHQGINTLIGDANLRASVVRMSISQDSAGRPRSGRDGPEAEAARSSSGGLPAPVMQRSPSKENSAHMSRPSSGGGLAALAAGGASSSTPPTSSSRPPSSGAAASAGAIGPPHTMTSGPLLSRNNSSSGRPPSGGGVMGRALLPGIGSSGGAAAAGASGGGSNGNGDASGRGALEGRGTAFEQAVEADIAGLQNRLQAMLQLASISVKQARDATTQAAGGNGGGLQLERMMAAAQLRISTQREVEVALSQEIKTKGVCTGLAEIKGALRERLSDARKTELAVAAKDGVAGARSSVLDGTVPEGHPVLAIRASLTKLELSVAPLSALLVGGGGRTGLEDVAEESDGDDVLGAGAAAAAGGGGGYGDSGEDSDDAVDFKTVFPQSGALPPNPFKLI